MQPITEKTLRLALQADIDDLDLIDLTENLFLRGSRLVQVAKCRIAQHGVNALDPSMDEIAKWWIRHTPAQETDWSFLMNQVHAEIGVAMQAQIRADAMQFAKAMGGS